MTRVVFFFVELHALFSASNVITADENKKPADDKTEIEEKKMSDGDDMKTQDELVKEVATIEIKN